MALALMVIGVSVWYPDRGKVICLQVSICQWGGVCSCGGADPEGVSGAGVPAPRGVPGGDPPMATAAGGMHPT